MSRRESDSSLPECEFCGIVLASHRHVGARMKRGYPVKNVTAVRAYSRLAVRGAAFFLLCAAGLLAGGSPISPARAADDVWWGLGGHVLPALSTAAVTKASTSALGTSPGAAQLTLTIVLR